MIKSFDDMLQEIYGITDREDLVTLSSTQLKAATLKMHQRDYYAKDLFESGIQFETNDFIQQLNYKSIVPLWRNLKYFRKFDISNTSQDSTSGTPGKFFKIITPEKIVDSYQSERVDVMYLAGMVYNIKSSTQFQYALMGCYVLPDVTSEGYNSWIADDFTYTIVFEAVRLIFKSIGMDEQAKFYDDLLMEQKAILDTGAILGEGY